MIWAGFAVMMQNKAREGCVTGQAALAAPEITMSMSPGHIPGAQDFSELPANSQLLSSLGQRENTHGKVYKESFTGMM